MRSDIFPNKKDLNYDKKRNTSKSEIKKFYGNAKNQRKFSKRYKNLGIIGGNLKNRDMSKSSFKNGDTISNHSQLSRKSRAMSSSSKASINMKEFSKLKFENQRYKHLLGEMVNKFMRFKEMVSKSVVKSSESGSSMVLEVQSRKSSTMKRHPKEDTKDFSTRSSHQDKIIQDLKEEITEKDETISQLRKELELLRNSGKGS